MTIVNRIRVWRLLPLVLIYALAACASPPAVEQPPVERAATVELATDEPPTATTEPTATDEPTTAPSPTTRPTNTARPTVAPTATDEPTQPPARAATVGAATALFATAEAQPTAAPPTAATATSAPAPTAAPTLAPPTAAPGSLVIIGVDKRAEVVTIRNDGGAEVTLAGWVLRSEKGSQDCGLGGVIGPGQTLQIWALAENAGNGGYNCGFGSNIWNNDDPDAALLIDPTGVVVSRW